jgi:hypothetical protein
VGRRSRKRSAAPQGAGKPAARRRAPSKVADSGNGARRPSRSAAKDAAARDALVPLREGERPTAVTVAAVVALLLGLGNVVGYAAGLEVGGEKPQLSGIVGPTVLMLVAAWGMWRAKYWAVLGMEAILGILIVLFSLLVLTAENVKSVLIALAVILPAATLFWFLVKALARIQMPERRT